MSKSGRLHFFAFYPDNFVGGTMFLSDEALGCYMRLLVAQWYRGSLPNDVEALVPIAMTIRQHWAVLADKFPVCEDGLRRNQRLEEEREKAAGRTERAIRGAASRWKSNGTDAQAMLKHRSSNAQASFKHMPRASSSSSGSISESLSCSESEKPQKASEIRACEKDAIESELDAIAASNGSALAYALSRDAVLVETWGKIPRKFATERTANMPLLANAVREAQAELGLAREDAAAHVAGRIVAYCDSDTGRSEYRGKLATWLKNGRWRESDDAWKRTAEEKAKPERKLPTW